MSPSFHLFTQLPTEIRLKIWEFALRPYDRGVHFFTVYNWKQDGRIVDEISIKDEDPNNGGHLLAAPPFGPSGRYSWTDNNPSAYLWDAGLWTACYESREVIDKHYSASQWLAARKAFAQSSSAAHDSAPFDKNGPFIHSIATNSFIHDNETRRFHLHPYHDLICLMPYSPSTNFWYAHPSHIMRDMAFINRPSAGLSGFANLAMEFDPSTWRLLCNMDNLYSLAFETGLQGNFIRALELMTNTRHEYRPSRLWLIDYNLKYLPAAEDIAVVEPVKFYGTDRVFVEVSRESCRKVANVLTAFDFLDHIAQVCGDQLREC